MMTVEDLQVYCLSKAFSEESIPFGPDVLVYKINGKIFALIGLDAEHPGISLKCDPDYAIELRDEYDEIQGAYHLNKKHWNSVRTDGKVKPKLVKELIDHSYELVAKNKKKS